MRRILLLIMSMMIWILTSCSAPPNSTNSTGVSPSPEISKAPSGTAISSVFIASDEFSRPGYAVEVDEYTFLTDFKSVYRMSNKTGETKKIFSSDENIISIFKYSGYIFVQIAGDIVLRMDFNGNDINTFKDMDIIFGADGYIYYANSDGIIYRSIVLGENEEFISNWFEETNGYDDIGFWSNYIGYHNGKVYYQENKKIYTMTKDGVKTYYCDGDYHSMKDSILILDKDKVYYRRDVDTGDEFEVYSYKGLYEYEEYVNGEYIGKYKENEYYLMDGYILSFNISRNKITKQEKLPFQFVEYAAITNGWIYIEYLDNGLMFSRYNLATMQKETISELPYMTPIRVITEYNNHLYYINRDEDGLFKIDLNDNSIKKIYNGKMNVYHLYI